MKNILLLAATVCVTAVLAVGCKPSETQSTSQQIENVKAETKTDANQMNDYAFAQKAEFVATMQGQLDALNKDIDALSTKIDSSSDAVKADAKPKLQALRDEAAGLNKRLDEAKNATESTWNGIETGSEKAYQGLKDDFRQARQWASDKIAPPQ
ncbi:MAG TPA: hypothetical protein VMR33_20435 [Candidatus Baltobacteraceae bacterium]|nr:hypothetical protein [Candidatus Baltobacteraceae bacterium]